MDMLCGRRNRALKFMILFSICSATIGMCACAGDNPVENSNTYAVSSNEICTSVSDNDAEANIQEMNVSHEIDEYIKRFMGLYTSNALEDMESQLMIEEGEFSSQNENGATIIKYSDLSGNTLRYELHYYGETGNRTVNYYLCENFYWISSQMNYYSSQIFKPDYLNVLYSEMDNWIVMGETVYVMHDSGKLEEADQAQLEIPLLEEVEGYAQERDSGEVPQLDEPTDPAHSSEWYPYEDILFEGDYEKARSHDFMNSGNQYVHMSWYYTLSDILYDYGLRTDQNLLTDGWVVDRITPIGNGYYNALLHQKSDDARMDVLIDDNEREYKVFYVICDNGERNSYNELKYMSQFDWTPYDYEKTSATVHNPFSEIYEASSHTDLCAAVTLYESEMGYDGQWVVEDIYAYSSLKNYLLTAEDRVVWFCLDVYMKEYTAETFYMQNTK